MQVQSLYQRFAQPLMQPLDVAVDINLGSPIEVSTRGGRYRVMEARESTVGRGGGNTVSNNL